MPTYTVETTLNPGVFYDVEQDEYQQLVEQGYVIGVAAASALPREVIFSATDPSIPTAPETGTVWAFLT